jgi:hypothetical protein
LRTGLLVTCIAPGEQGEQADDAAVADDAAIAEVVPLPIFNAREEAAKWR